MPQSSDVEKGGFGNQGDVLVKGEVPVKGNTQGFNTVRERDRAAGNVDSTVSRIVAESLSSAKDNGFRFAAIKGHAVFAEPGEESRETDFKLFEMEWV